MPRALFILLSLCGVCWADPPTIDPESVEPPLGLSLHIGEEVVRVQDGQPIRLSGNFTNPQVKVLTDDFRTFAYAGISFRYPKDFAFEADLDGKPVLRRWTLDGKDCIIFVHAFSAEDVSLDSAVDGLLGEYGKQNCKVTPASITLAGQKLDGRKVVAKLTVSATIEQAIFRLPTTSGTKMLMLQDTPKNDGTPSDERKFVGKLLMESFKATTPK